MWLKIQFHEAAYKRKHKVKDPIRVADMVPESDQIALFCMAMAKGDLAAYERLYERTPYGELHHLHYLQTAATWSLERNDGRRT